MKPRAVSISVSVLVAASAGVFVLAFVWPAIALIVESIVPGRPPDGGWTFSSRQWSLLEKSVKLAGYATLLCLALSLPGAYVLGQARGLTHRPVLVGMLMALLLCSPMVYAFGWQRIVPARLWQTAQPAQDTSPQETVRQRELAQLVSAGKCVGIWALWAWPIPALIIGSGFSRIGRQAQEAALLDTSTSIAFAYVVLPLLLRYVTAGAVVLLVLFLGEYSVPHACGLTVFATELLGRAVSSSFTIDVAWCALLPTAVILAGLGLLYAVWRWLASDEETIGPAGAHRRSGKPACGLVYALLAISFALPIGALALNLRPLSVIALALRTYWWEVLCSLGIAAVGGLAAVGVGLGMFSIRRLGVIALVVALVFGALPGALIGKALVAAYLPEVFRPIYDSWVILAICYVSRFGWIGLLVGWLIVRNTPRELIAQARTDGASRGSMMGLFYIPMHLPTLACAASVIAALSLSDVASSSLVRVPQVNLIAHIIIEKFHRLEDGMLITLSLCLVAVSLPVALVLASLLHRQDERMKDEG